MSDRTAKRYSKRRKSMPIEIEQDDGTVKNYTLYELMGDDREDYLGFMSTKMKAGTRGQRGGLKDVKGMHVKLISLSLRDEEGRPVPEDEIRTWPSSVLGGVFADAQEISGLGEVGEEEKN